MGYFKRNRPGLFDGGLSEIGGLPVPTATQPALSNLTLYFVDSAASGSAHGTLQLGGSPPSVATMGTGAVLGTTHAANEFADMAYASIQPATAFTTTTGPSAATGTTKCFRSATTMSGSFAHGNWKIALAVIMTSAATSGNAAIRVRFYRGTSATGSGAQEITQATQASGNANIALTAQQNLSILFNANAITLEAEYLFIAIGFEILSGASSSTGNTIKLVQDPANSAVTTPAFTSGAQTLYLLGTSQGTTGNPLGPDNSCDQVLAGGVWGQILPEATTNNGSDASACVDPATGIFYLFGNFDGGDLAYSYNPITHTYTSLGNPPANCWGGGGCAILNGIAYMMGGFITGTGAGSTEVYSYNIAGASYSTSFTPLATGIIDCPAIAVGSLVYHGGGDLGDGTGSPVTSWFKWDPITDTRTSLAALPVALGGMAIAALGGFIYIFGGYTTGSTNYQATTGVYRYSIAGNSWTTMNSLPVAVNYARACVFNGQIWMAGGITSAGFGAYTTATWTYNVALDSWNYQGPLSTPIFGSVLGASPPSSGGTAYTKSISESITGPSDGVARAGVFTRSLSDSVSGPSDSVARSFVAVRSITESRGAPSDAVARALAALRSISESITGPSDSTARAFVVGRSVTESISAPSDAAARAFVGSRAVGESVTGPTDSLARAFVSVRAIGESIAAPSDAVARSTVESRSLSESVTAPSDAVSRAFVGRRAIAETVTGPTDSVGVVLGQARAIAESVTGPSDAVSRAFSGARAIAESVAGPSDAVSRAIVNSRAISETVTGPSDAVARSVAAHRALSESVTGPSDSLSRAAVGQRAIGESLTTPSDALARAIATLRGIAESITSPSDSVIHAVPHNIAESIASPSDALTRAFVGHRAIGESVSAPGDAVNRAIVSLRSIGESVVGPSDSVVRLVVPGRSISESVAAPSDAIVRSFVGHRAIAEAVALPSDSLTGLFVRSRAIAESIGAPSDSVASAFGHGRLIFESVATPSDSVTVVFSASGRVLFLLGPPSSAPFSGKLSGQAPRALDAQLGPPFASPLNALFKR